MIRTRHLPISGAVAPSCALISSIRRALKRAMISASSAEAGELLCRPPSTASICPISFSNWSRALASPWTASATMRLTITVCLARARWRPFSLTMTRSASSSRSSVLRILATLCFAVRIAALTPLEPRVPRRLLVAHVIMAISHRKSHEPRCPLRNSLCRCCEPTPFLLFASSGARSYWTSANV